MDQLPETVIINDSKFGKGIFTTISLKKNSVILKISGTPLNFQNTLELGENECYSLQVGIDRYIIPHSPFHLSNHSCSPNCGINKNMEFFALCDIAAGDELVWDYSTSMMERHWTMECACGSHECRDVIRDFDLLPVQLQDKYLYLGIVLPFIVEHLFGLPTIEKVKHSRVSSL